MKEAKIIQYRTFGFEIEEVKQSKEDDSVGRIEGYASTFENIDLGLDKVAKGAFKRTINAFKHWPILADHNPTKQIGTNVKASEDSTGLAVMGELELGVQEAKERFLLAKQAKRIGGKSGLSIGYMTIQSEPDADNPRVRVLKEIKLFEYSLVTFPMNTEALLTSAKSTGNIDKAVFLIKQLQQQGISLKDFEIALRQESAKAEMDPVKIGHSIDNLIEKFRNG